jgi:hypothetical protein
VELSHGGINSITSTATHWALDALCSQIQEDLAICECRQDDNHISWLHLCLPNHWAAADKIGQNFVSAHAVMPGMERINQHATTLINTLIHKGPFERFTWGLATDTRLNRHPRTAEKTPATKDSGRCFDSSHPQLYLRVERQVTIGLPDVDAFTFLIRTYLYDVTTLDKAQLQQLSHALTTMPPDIRVYKGLAHSTSAIIRWLDALQQ